MNRRSFLKTAGTVSAATSLGTAAGLAVPSLSPFSPLSPLSSLLGASPAMAAASAGGEESAAALQSLSALFEQLEQEYFTPVWGIKTAEERTTARFYLMHLLHHGCQFWFEADPERPWFHRWFTPYKKLLGDNPDALYYGSVIDGARDYRIRGNVNGAVYTSFTVEKGSQQGRPSTGLLSTINDTEFQIDSDGSYELIASPNKQSGNWLKTGPDASAITTRHYFETQQSAANDPLLHIPLAIEPVIPPTPAPLMDDAALAAGIQRIINFIRSATIDAQNPLDRKKQPAWASQKPNQFANPETDVGNDAIGYAAKDNVYRMAPYSLKPDQALVIRGRFPKCRFANVVLFNRHIQTAPNRYRQVSLNRTQTKLEADGSFKIIVAHSDPGVPNWLDTAGAPLATIFWRFQLPETRIAPLRTEVVPLSSLVDSPA